MVIHHINTKINILSRRFIARNLFIFAQLWVTLKLMCLHFSKKPLVLILTSGKVGSSSVYYSLKKQLKLPIFHIHYFSKQGIIESKKKHLASNRKSLPLHLIVAEGLTKFIKFKNNGLNIITLTREPIGRTISGFFQNTEIYGVDVEQSDLMVDYGKARQILEGKLKTRKDTEKKWFDQEIKNTFGIDVFSVPFDVKKGFNVYSNNGNKLLLIRMEDLGRVFSTAVKEAFNKEGVILYNRNIGDYKIYNKTYQKIKNDLNLSPDQFRLLTQTEFFQKFYHDHIEQLKNKWCK